MDKDDVDERFKQVGISRKFAAKGKDKAKIKVDDRFKSMFTDKDFNSSSAPVDKYGRKVSKKERNEGEELKRFYKLDEEDSKPKESRLEYLNKLARGEVEALESESDSGSAGELEIYSDAEDKVMLSDVSDVPEGDATHRFAVQNLEWTRLSAQDIYTALNSFVPPGGVLQAVTVYVSIFGEERMAFEDTHGPAMFEKKEDISDDSDMDEVANEGNQYSKEKLRKYELSRLKYYFAVAVFDSVQTANAVYSECDGVEFERSSIEFDLRFVPDTVEFDRPVRDKAIGISDDYEAPYFINKAKQSTDVELTWDEDDPVRQKLHQWNEKSQDKKTKTKLISERMLEEFIASDAESIDDSDLDEREMRKKSAAILRNALLQDDSDSSGEELSGGELSGHEEIGGGQKPVKTTKKILPQKPDEAQNPFDDPFFLDPSSVSKKQLKMKSPVEKQGSKLTEQQRQEKQMAELDLLLLDEKQKKTGKGLECLDFKAIVKGEKLLKKGGKLKGKKRKEKQETIDAVQNDSFKVNAGDERFSSLFSDPDFSVDRTSSLYKDTKAMRELEQEKLSRRKFNKSLTALATPKGESSELTSIVESIKHKSAMAASNKKRKMK